MEQHAQDTAPTAYHFLNLLSKELAINKPRKMYIHRKCCMHVNKIFTCGKFYNVDVNDFPMLFPCMLYYDGIKIVFKSNCCCIPRVCFNSHGTINNHRGSIKTSRRPSLDDKEHMKQKTQQHWRIQYKICNNKKPSEKNCDTSQTLQGNKHCNDL